jgi:hypothetical protein
MRCSRKHRCGSRMYSSFVCASKYQCLSCTWTHWYQGNDAEAAGPRPELTSVDDGGAGLRFVSDPRRWLAIAVGLLPRYNALLHIVGWFHG